MGSDARAKLRIDHPDVAAAHVRVVWDELGVSVADAESGRGTWLNGERVEAAPLGDGDVVQFADPKQKPAAPVLRVRLPRGLAETEPEAFAARPRPRPRPAPPEPGTRPAGASWRAPAAATSATGRRVAPRRRLGYLAAALVLLAGSALAVKLLRFTAPRVESLQPAAAEPGRVLTVTGARFSTDPAGNTVWFGDLAVGVESASEDVLHVKVPARIAPGDVRLAVETPDGRSKGQPFRVLPVLHAEALVPEGGRPGEEVVLRGEGFTRAVGVSVGGVPATVVTAGPDAVRFFVPDGVGAPGARVPVIATVDGRSTAPLTLVLGRVPLVEEVVPSRASGGEAVRVRGVGFAPEPEGNLVTLDGVPALVVAASRTELVVVAPVPPRPQAETAAPLVVQAFGRASEPRPVSLLRLVDGAWVPRCVAQPARDPASPARVLVGTEIGPLFLLSWKDEAPSTALRALATCAQIDAAFGRARVGERVRFEARDDPAGGVGVGVVGRADTIVRVTAQDAAAYGAPPGLSPRREAPSAPELARHWAALLDDLVTVSTTGEAPAACAALSPLAGRAFAELRAALPWQYGAGVPSRQVASLSPELRRRVREAALSGP